MLTNLYVDGFNLYYRAVQEKPRLKWLDLRKLAQALFPGDAIQSIHYFTSPLIDRPGEDEPRERQKQRRQLVYLEALRTIPGLTIHLGTFQPQRNMRRLVSQPSNKVLVHDVSEKKSDVSLATRLIVDGCKGSYEQASVLSEDSDFVEAIRSVREELGLPVILVNPSPRKADEPNELRDVATRVVRVRERHLEQSQFPDVVYGPNERAVRKPPEWS